MTSPTKDSSIDGSPKINNPITGFGSSSSPADPTQQNETQTPTSTEVEPSQTLPLSPPPTFTSSGGVCEITSDHVNVIDLPPPPPFIPLATISVGSSSGRKRGRPRKESSSGGDGESSTSTGHNKLLRGDHEHAPIKCVVCGKEFMIDKAYFGHLRKHPDRQWRGAYPPAEVKKLGPTLLELANQTIARMSTSYSSSGSSLGINLNINPSNPPPPPPPPPRRTDGGALPFDLNMSPPQESDEEEEEEDPYHAHHPNHSDI